MLRTKHTHSPRFESLEDRRLLAIAPTSIWPGTLSATGAPTLNTPVPTVRWNTVPGATGYGIVIAKSGVGGYTTVYNSESAPPFPSPVKGNSFTVPAALTAGTYRWQVRAFDAGGAGSYAPPLYFTLTTTGYNRAVGIDISNFQTVSSWSTVKTNGTTSTTTDDTSFVYAKATEGFTFDDAKFISHANGAAGAGIPFGAYHFARPGNNSAASEAQHFYSIISSRLTAGNMIPMLDFEDTAANSVALGKAALSQWVNDFGDAFFALSGLVPIVYTFVSYATSYLNTSVIRYPLWQAQYPTSAANPTIPVTSGAPSGTSPWPTSAWSMWQYTSNRTVAGISSGNVDSDVTNSDISTFYGMFKILSNTKGSISGTLFDDANSNGIRDGGEAVFASRNVYLDANNNGTRDTGELQATTNASGVYTFSNLAAGSYYVRQVVPGGYSPTGAAVYSLQLAAGQVVTGKDFGSSQIDSTPPSIDVAEFHYELSPNTITIVFSEALSVPPSQVDFGLSRIDTPSVGIDYTFTYSPATLTATITPTTPLANGDYRVVLSAATVTDMAGNNNQAFSYDFFALAGDVNRDRAVNFDDLLIVAQNYDQTGMTYADGDLNADGTVNFDDLLVLAQNYDQLLLAQPRTSSKTAQTAKRPRVL